MTTEQMDATDDYWKGRLAVPDPQKYTKKPVEIEAMEWVGGREGALPIVEWVRASGGYAQYDPRQHFVNEHITIATLEGPITASPGDFIIRGTKGEFYPCKPDIFRAIHEMPVEAVAPEAVSVLAFDLETGGWLSPKPVLTYEQGIRVAASMLPGVSEEQLVLWLDEQKFDQGPGQ